MCHYSRIANTQGQASSKPTVSNDDPGSVPEIIPITQTKNICHARFALALFEQTQCKQEAPCGDVPVAVKG